MSAILLNNFLTLTSLAMSFPLRAEREGAGFVAADEVLYMYLIKK